jgi:hypothetical protein
VALPLAPGVQRQQAVRQRARLAEPRLLRQLPQPRDVVPAALFDAVYAPPERSGDAPPEPAVQTLLAAIQGSTATERCYTDAQRLIEGARRELSVLPAGPARDALHDLAGYVISRHG